MGGVDWINQTQNRANSGLMWRRLLLLLPLEIVLFDGRTVICFPVSVRYPSELYGAPIETVMWTSNPEKL
jgi:hypothetical protein